MTSVKGRCKDCKFAAKRTDEYIDETRLKCRNKFSPFEHLGYVPEFETCWMFEKKKGVKDDETK